MLSYISCKSKKQGNTNTGKFLLVGGFILIQPVLSENRE